MGHITITLFLLCLKKGKGIYVWDVEGKKYIDFLSAYSAVNQGHSNAKIVKVLADQSNQLSLTSRAFHNDKFSQFAKMATSYFGFDMMLPMNTGAEAVETAIKLARKWGVQKKELLKTKLRLLFAKTIFMAEQRRLFRSPQILSPKRFWSFHSRVYHDRLQRSRCARKSIQRTTQYRWFFG